MRHNPTMPMGIDDPRLLQAQCMGLSPIETLHENPWFVVRNRGGYFTAEYREPQAIVLPVVDDQAVVMVRVKRPVIADVTLELPAGGIGHDEKPQRGAARELYEETGIQIGAHRFESLIPLSNSPNRNPKLIHIFKVGLTQREYDQRAGHDDEIESVAMFPFEEIWKMIVGGQIFVGVPLAVLGRFFLERVQFGLDAQTGLSGVNP